MVQSVCNSDVDETHKSAAARRNTIQSLLHTQTHTPTHAQSIYWYYYHSFKCVTRWSRSLPKRGAQPIMQSRQFCVRIKDKDCVVCVKQTKRVVGIKRNEIDLKIITYLQWFDGNAVLKWCCNYTLSLNEHSTCIQIGLCAWLHGMSTDSNVHEMKEKDEKEDDMFSIQCVIVLCHIIASFSFYPFILSAVFSPFNDCVPSLAIFYHFKSEIRRRNWNGVPSLSKLAHIK